MFASADQQLLPVCMIDASRDGSKLGGGILSHTSTDCQVPERGGQLTNTTCPRCPWLPTPGVKSC